MKKLLCLIGVTILLASCGGGSGGSGVSTMDKLPKMTSPVITSGASSSSVKVNAATTGLPFWGTTASSFNSTSSRGMCEMFNLSRESLNRAAQADKILCYIQNTVASDANKATIDASGVNIYDGQFHTVTLNFAGGSPNPNSTNTLPVMKFKIVKTGDSITEFEMFNCMGGTAASPLQSEYMHQVIEGENVNIVSKNIETGGGQTWKSHFTTVGKINSDLNYTEKVITALTNWTVDANNYNYQKATFNQYADRLKVSGSQGGKCGTCGGSGAYANHVYSEFQLLNGTDSDLHKLAVGDGSLKSVFTYGTGDPESWAGDTTKPLADWTTGDNYSVVNAGTVPTEDPTAESQAITFVAASEAWDCSDTSEVTVAVDQADLNTKCDSLGLVPDGENTWIDCWGTIGN